MSDTLTSQIVPVGDAFKTWMSSELSSLSLNSFEWHRHMRDQPSYPADPRNACPRGFIRLDQAGHTTGDGGLGCAQAGFVYQFSLWLQYLQTPGQAHQRLLCQGIDVIHTAILREEFDLAEVIGLYPVYEIEVEIIQSTVFSELEHEYRDPALRVSVAQTSFTLSGQLREPA